MKGALVQIVIAIVVAIFLIGIGALIFSGNIKSDGELKFYVFGGIIGVLVIVIVVARLIGADKD